MRKWWFLWVNALWYIYNYIYINIYIYRIIYIYIIRIYIYTYIIFTYIYIYMMWYPLAIKHGKLEVFAELFSDGSFAENQL